MGNQQSGPICGASACNVTLTLPLGPGYSASQRLACLLLVPLSSSAQGAKFMGTTSGISLVSSSTSAANCTTSSWGKALLVQYTPPAGAGAGSPGAQQGMAEAAPLRIDNSALPADQMGMPVQYLFT
jgi:hypothetical protein